MTNDETNPNHKIPNVHRCGITRNPNFGFWVLDFFRHSSLVIRYRWGVLVVRYRVILCALLGSLIPIAVHSQETNPPSAEPRYETRAHHDPNGIAKFYLRREIAAVRRHQAADWLERPARASEERTDLSPPGA